MQKTLYSEPIGYDLEGSIENAIETLLNRKSYLEEMQPNAKIILDMDSEIYSDEPPSLHIKAIGEE